jgi:hypothetical protein
MTGSAIFSNIIGHPYAPILLGVPRIVPFRREARHSWQRPRKLLEVAH